MFIPTVPLSIRLDGELLLLVRLVIGVHVFLTFIIWFYLYKFWTNSQPETSSDPSETEAKTEESKYSNGLYTIDEEPQAQEAQQQELELYQKPPPQEALEKQLYQQQMPQKQQTPPQKKAQQQKKPQSPKVPKKKQAPQQQQQEEEEGEETYMQPQPVKPRIVCAPNRGRTSPKWA